MGHMAPREGSNAQTSHDTHGTAEPCEVCGGPCRDPFRVPVVIQASYPFLRPEEIAAMNEAHEPEGPAAPEQVAPARGRRRGEDRARRLDEDRAHHLEADR